MTQRFLGLLLLSIALAGCGGASPSHPRTAPAPSGETVHLADVAWQAELEPREQGKITLPLWRWLDGDPAGDPGQLAGAERTSVRVEVRLRHGLFDDELDHYARLGLEATEGDDAPTGSVTRAQLLELARDHNVLRLDAAAAADSPAEPSETATAQADTPARTPAL